MRSTNEIVIAVKESQPATDQELRYCVLALSAMEYFARHNLNDLVDCVLNENQTVRMRAEFSKNERENRFQSAKMPVDQYLGPRNTPGTPEYEAGVKMSKALFAKATGIEL
jgi:hypothetical protein